MLVLFPVVLTWSSDTFAYFAGRRWGTRKLIPRVSPGKTVQGAVGAVVGTVLVAVLYTFLLARFPTYRVGALEAVVFGLVISVAAQVGDLAESLFKRDAGVKDSGTLLPGHGGALDRLRLAASSPSRVAYLFFRFVVGAGVPRCWCSEGRRDPGATGSIGASALAVIEQHPDLLPGGGADRAPQWHRAGAAGGAVEPRTGGAFRCR